MMSGGMGQDNAMMSNYQMMMLLLPEDDDSAASGSSSSSTGKMKFSTLRLNVVASVKYHNTFSTVLKIFIPQC